MQIDFAAAETRLPKQLKCAQAGEEVVIANRGKPVARLVPIPSKDALSPLPAIAPRVQLGCRREYCVANSESIYRLKPTFKQHEHHGIDGAGYPNVHGHPHPTTPPP